MNRHIDYRTIWPNDGHKKMCVNCRRREADVFFCVRDAPQGVARTHYLCAHCFYAGVLDVLEERQATIVAIDIHTDLSTPDNPPPGADDVAKWGKNGSEW